MNRAFHISIFTAIAFSVSIAQAQTPQQWQAQLARLRQQGQQPNIQWENTELTGSIKAMSGSLVQVEASGGENWVVQIDARPQDIWFQGTADPAFLKPGMLVEFKARLNKRGTASEPVSSLTIFTVREGRSVGVAPEGSGAGSTVTELFSSKPDEPEKKGKKDEDPVYQVAGQLTKISRGEMTINCAGTVVKADLAKDAKVTVDVNHLRFAQPGDKVEIRARYPMGQKAAGQALATQITVMGSKPLGEPKKRVLPGKPDGDDAKADEKSE
jgi:hypothetical protein